MSRTTDVLLFLILIVNLMVYYELIYGPDAPRDPPMTIYGIAAIGFVALLGGFVLDSIAE